jgi:hypothetical protein
VKHSFPRWLALIVLASGSFLVLAAQQPGALPLDLDPEIWGCRNHPYVATLETTSTSIDQPVEPDHARPHQVKAYRDTAGDLRTDALYDSGLPMTILFRSPAKPVMMMLNVVEKTGIEIPVSFPDRSRASEFWSVSTLPARNILGLETVGLRYIHTLAAKPGSRKTSATVVEDYWMSLTACVVLERHLTNPLVGSLEERVTKLEQREPDPKLLEIPPEYVIHQATDK